jgi:hypothetical protein
VCFGTGHGEKEDETEDEDGLEGYETDDDWYFPHPDDDHEMLGEHMD